MRCPSERRQEYRICTQRADAGELQRKPVEIGVLASDLAAHPTESSTDALVYVGADVLRTIRMDEADRLLATSATGIG